jgi:hypothetical protein
MKKNIEILRSQKLRGKPIIWAKVSYSKGLIALATEQIALSLYEFI